MPKKYYYHRWFCIISILLSYGINSYGAVYKIGSLTGIMKQPSSNYYHFTYGGYGEFGNEKETILLRIGYVERPLYSELGFQDQESMIFAILGTKILNNKWHGLYAYFGYGEVTGFIKADDNIDPNLQGVKRDFRLPGPTAAIEYNLRLFKLDIALSHQTLIGYTDNEQLRAYVAWPYNFIFLKIGMSI